VTAEKLLKIGEVARLAGKSVRAVRYYEELGLIRSAAHTKGGFRLFTPEDARRIRLVDKFHELGFSLEEIAGIVQAYRHGSCGDDVHRKLRPLLEKSLQTIRAKVALLEGFRKEIEDSLRFVCDCDGCRQKPERAPCLSCEKGDHKRVPPPSVIKMVL
jgi:DNA-binding transcriptional MerR regulator